MPIALIAAALVSIFVAVGVGVRNFVKPASVPTTSGSVVMTLTPTPTYEPEEVLPVDSNPSGRPATPTVSVAASSPTPTTKVTQPTPTTQTPTAARTLATSTPTPNPDTQAPTLDYMTGPGEGTTVDFNSFCFPMKFTDANMTGIMVRYAMDVQSPTDWNQNYAPCFSSVTNGAHTFRVQAKDAAGNVSNSIIRNFTVQVANPTGQITQTPTP